MVTYNWPFGTLLTLDKWYGQVDKGDIWTISLSHILGDLTLPAGDSHKSRNVLLIAGLPIMSVARHLCLLWLFPMPLSVESITSRGISVETGIWSVLLSVVSIEPHMCIFVERINGAQHWLGRPSFSSHFLQLLTTDF